MLQNPANDPALEAVRTAFTSYYTESTAQQLDVPPTQAEVEAEAANASATEFIASELQEKAEKAASTLSKRKRVTNKPEAPTDE